MTRGYSGGKRQREAERDRKKKEKQERLRQNRAMRGSGGDEPGQEVLGAPVDAGLPEVKLEDIVIGVPQRPKRSSIGPVKLFVGGLSWDVSTEELRTAFSK